MFIIIAMFCCNSVYDERAQALPAQCGQQLRHRHQAAGGDHGGHGHPTTQAGLPAVKGNLIEFLQSYATISLQANFIVD